jgi:archaetidylinositol phosphate synthase
MITKHGFEDAERTQQSLLAPLERRLLHALARRMPDRVRPDHLTSLGLGSLVVAGLLYAAASRAPLALLLVNVCLVANWFGDSLDGTLARVRGKLRPRYGFYVDHIVDAFGALFVLGGLAVSGYVTPAVALALLVAFLLFSVEVYLTTYCLGTFRLSYFKFSPTEMRVLLVVGNCVAYARPRVRVLGADLPFFDVGLGIAAAVMVATVVVSAVAHTRALFAAERV